MKGSLLFVISVFVLSYNCIEGKQLISNTGSKSSEFVVNENQNSLTEAVSGTPVSLGAYPYTVFITAELQNSEMNTYICAGTLLTADWVLTSASCALLGTNKLRRVFAGRTNIGSLIGEQNTVSSYKVHPNYNATSPLYDIALIKVSESFDLENGYINTISLDQDNVNEDTSGLVLGWPNSERLTSVKVVTTENCSIHNKQHFTNKSVPVSMICAASSSQSSDVCVTELGSPLVSNNKLIGVVSLYNDCFMLDNRTSLYTSVPYYYQWIEDTMNSASGHYVQKLLVFVLSYIALHIVT